MKNVFILNEQSLPATAINKHRFHNSMCVWQRQVKSMFRVRKYSYKSICFNILKFRGSAPNFTPSEILGVFDMLSNFISASGVQKRNPFSNTAYVKMTCVKFYIRIRQTCKIRTSASGH